MPGMEFLVNSQVFAANVRNLVVAGWTGRDARAVEDHIAELAALGVARPRAMPCFYSVGTNLLTTSEHLDVCGNDSSGEVEFVLLSQAAGLFVGIGSDHTDRKVEAYGVTVAKQMCPKPIGRELWSYEDVKGHWDALILRSWVTRNGERGLYQEGGVTRMRTPEDLVSRYVKGPGPLPVGTIMYCGTLPVLGALGGGEQFEIELEDPVKARRLAHIYNVRSLAYMD